MFKEVLAKIEVSFKIHSIPYMIIGGQAVLLYGEPRFTKNKNFQKIFKKILKET